MSRMRSSRLLIALLALPVLGCGGKQVTRIESDTTVDLSGKWNDTDSRLVSEEMIQDCMSQTWLRRHMQSKSAVPVVVVGAIRNKTLEHIPVDTFIKDIERAFVNSGEVTVVADVSERPEVRAERESMQGNVTAETLKKFGKEVGADYIMMGSINQINDREGGDEVKYYQTDLELINAESNVKVWIGQKKIKKFVSKSKFKG